MNFKNVKTEPVTEHLSDMFRFTTKLVGDIGEGDNDCLGVIHGTVFLNKSSGAPFALAVYVDDDEIPTILFNRSRFGSGWGSFKRVLDAAGIGYEYENPIAEVLTFHLDNTINNTFNRLITFEPVVNQVNYDSVGAVFTVLNAYKKLAKQDFEAKLAERREAQQD